MILQIMVVPEVFEHYTKPRSLSRFCFSSSLRGIIAVPSPFPGFALSVNFLIGIVSVNMMLCPSLVFFLRLSVVRLAV